MRLITCSILDNLFQLYLLIAKVKYILCWKVRKYVVIFVEDARDILILIVKLGAKHAHIPEAR